MSDLRRFILGLSAVSLLTACADGAKPPGPEPDAARDAARTLDQFFFDRDAEPDAGDTNSGRPPASECERHPDCLSGICLSDYDGALRCMEPCNPAIGAGCEPGYDCREAGDGPDARFGCLPRTNSLCSPCEQDFTCGPTGRCLEMRGGAFCALDCQHDGFCPSGYACEVRNDGAWCVPPGGASCAACRDMDGDGFGAGDACAGADCDDGNPNRHPNGVEQCNGVDDDCDGTVDESPAPPGEDVSVCPSMGVCAAASSTCERGEWRCRFPEGREADEQTCDGLDNDCDGVVDEVAGVGETCEVGTGLCLREGRLACLDGALRCRAEPGLPMSELCNGLDDDCDGVLDEVAGIGDDCTDGFGRCAVPGQLVCDIERVALVCNAQARPGDLEVCNGVDDDCDERVDEGTRNACGECGPEPAETCDGADEDCDGDVDEGLESSPIRCGRGACAMEGRRVCRDGRWHDDCAPADPSPEVCNGLDDDCDGAIDDALDLEPVVCGRGACERSVQPVCANGVFRGECVPGEPSPELCNDIDDDCDGSLDEGTLNACGDCGPAPVETCNGVDEDCDGNVDEGVESSPIRCGRGACAMDGRRLCRAGRWHDDCTPAGPSPEVCNGLDDDCHGVIDNAIELDPVVCGRGACERIVQPICAQGVVRGECVPGEPSPELCNGVDDDCNGRIDDGIAPEPVMCGRGACAAAGERTCEGGSLHVVCVEGTPGDELCDGEDNDCDGVADEALDRVERCGVGACVHEVEQACVEGSWSPSCRPGLAGAESCNGLDDDCDERIDEGTDDFDPWAACRAPDDAPCSDIGTRHREVRICEGGRLRVDEEDEACRRDAEGEACGFGRICREGVCECDGEPAYLTCHEGAVWRHDLCGHPVEPEPYGCEVWEVCRAPDPLSYECVNAPEDPCDGVNCPRLEVCRDGACRCERPDEQRCEGGDVWRFDGCSGAQLGGGPIEVCEQAEVCEDARCIPAPCDADGDGFCPPEDCDDGDPLRHPEHREVWDIRDNDCDGWHDEVSRDVWRRVHINHGSPGPGLPDDWEHRFVQDGAGVPPGAIFDGHWIQIYPNIDFCNAAGRPLDGCARIAGGREYRLWGGYTLVALAECSGPLRGWRYTLYLPEDSGEYEDYADGREGLICRRIGYVPGGVTANDIRHSRRLYRHRSVVHRDDMWSVEQNEGEPLYGAHEPDWHVLRAGDPGNPP